MNNKTDIAGKFASLFYPENMFHLPALPWAHSSEVKGEMSSTRQEQQQPEDENGH